MKENGNENENELIFLGKWKGSGDSNCPSLYYDPKRGTYLVQGWKVTDPKRLAKLEIPEHESVVEVPVDVIEHALKRNRELAQKRNRDGAVTATV